MVSAGVLCNIEDALAAVGATDALVYRRAVGGRFVLTGPLLEGAADELTVDDEPLLRRSLSERVCRVASETPRPICGGYLARAAAVVCIDPDVVVVLGRLDGCLAGVGDYALLGAAAAVAAAQGATSR